MQQHPALESALAELEKLISFDTTSHKSNLELIDYVATSFDQSGIPHSQVTNDVGNKASILGTLGKEEDGGIVLSGHTDVVPVDGQDWKTNPFKTEIKDDKLYGRGSCDMKGFIACALAMIPTFKERAKQPVHFAFSYDEEVGCLSAPQLAEHLSEQNFKPELMVIGEPTDMEVVDAHKSIHSYITTIKGLEGHSSNPDAGVNAVQIGADLCRYIDGIAEEMKRSDKVNPRFTPQHTTVHIGKFLGGTARNIIPNHAEIWWEMRGIPNEDLDAAFAKFDAYCQSKQAEMQKIHPEARIYSEPQSRVPGLAEEQENPTTPKVLHACGHNHTHAVAFGTEAGVFQQHGFRAIVCGPGSIKQAHKANEFVEISQLNECLWFLDKLICGV